MLRVALDTGFSRSLSRQFSLIALGTSLFFSLSACKQFEALKQQAVAFMDGFSDEAEAETRDDPDQYYAPAPAPRASPNNSDSESTENKKEVAQEVLIEFLNSESLGKLKIGMRASQAAKVVGKPKKKTKSTKEEATGQYVSTWRYPRAKGLQLRMTSETKGGPFVLDTIELRKPAKLKTARGIRIGSARSEVSETYGDMEGEGSSPQSFVAGSLSSGLIFSFKKDKVSKIVLGSVGE